MRAKRFTAAVRASSPRHQVSLSDEGTWVVASSRGTGLREQGWKIHVSAGPRPQDVLRRCLAVLSAEPVHFKVLASTSLLLDQSAGYAGLSQVGKFITVYPDSDAEAVRLAWLLDAATTGCEGPSIPSDRALRPGSVVHYRFGSFSGRPVATLLGAVEPAIRDPEGRLVPAGARPFYQQPSWTNNPFVSSIAQSGGDSEPAPQPEAFSIAGRYIPLRVLSRSARGRTWLALDTDKLRRCVIKQALPWVVLGRDGSDARRRLAHEGAVLSAVAPLAVGPRRYDLFAQEDGLYLVMEDIAGVTLDIEVMQRIVRDGLPTARFIARLGIAVASALARLHRRGWVHRDLKPQNVIRLARRCVLLDFELSLPAGAAPGWGAGTDGYMSPQQRSGGVATPSDDLYGLGALLLFAATGRHPPTGGRAAPLHASRIADVNRGFPDALAAIIRRCVDGDPDRRPASADHLVQQFRAWLQTKPGIGRQSGNNVLPVGRSPTAVGPVSRAVRKLSGALENAIRRWLEADDSRASLHVNDGVAGGLLVLCELAARAPGDARCRLLRDASYRLKLSARGLATAGSRLSGLYVGDAGLALAVLRAGTVLGDRSLMAAGTRAAWSALGRPTHSPDLFHGLAGRLWLALQVYDCAPSAHRDRVLRAAANELVAQGKRGRWVIPAGYAGLSGQAYHGFAHGTAGIGWVLLAAARRTPDPVYRRAVAACARRLRNHAVSTMGGRGTTWPVCEDDPLLPGPFWCHGAAGGGAFFLDLWRHTRKRGDLAVAVSAAHTVAAGRWLGPTQCHGLSGSIEFLVDLYQATRDPKWRNVAIDLGELLADYFLTVAPISRMTEIGLMTGFPGGLTALLRLDAPDTSRRVILAALP